MSRTNGVRNAVCFANGIGSLSPAPNQTAIQKFNLLWGESWVSKPGTGRIGFVSRFCAILWYVCVRKSDMDPDRTEIDFGTPLPKQVRKYARILSGESRLRQHNRSPKAYVLHWGVWGAHPPQLYVGFSGGSAPQCDIYIYRERERTHICIEWTYISAHNKTIRQQQNITYIYIYICLYTYVIYYNCFLTTVIGVMLFACVLDD